MLMFIGALDRILFIKLRLKQYQLAKELFVLELEQGHEVYIPEILQNSSLPQSYKYYDFLSKYIQDQVSHQCKDNILFKSSQRRIFKDKEMSTKFDEFWRIEPRV